MDILKSLRLVLAVCPLFGCQLGYYMHSAYHQSVLLNSREPIDKVLRGNRISDEEKRKLRLVQEVKNFGEQELYLRKSQNYSTFVKIDDPFVTYVVQAAFKWELKPYHWKFPLIGEVPYKGYFVKAMALEEAASFPRD